MGGGYIHIYDDKKRIIVNGDAGKLGKADHRYTAHVLKTEFPNY